MTTSYAPRPRSQVSPAAFALISLLAAHCADAQSVWTGGTSSLFSTGTNFTPSIANTASSNLTVQFNGSDATTTDITLATAFGGGAGGAGSTLSILSAQTNALTITGSGTAAIRLNSSGLTVQSGAGAVTFAGSGNINIGGLASATSHTISNQSSALLDFGSWAIVAGGGGARNLTVEAAGNIRSNGNWSNSVSPLPSTNPLSLTKTGAGKLTLGGTNTVTGNTLVSAGVLELTNSLALQGSALDTSGAGSVTVVGPTSLTIGGLTGGASLASVITTGYSGLTSLTLNPLSGTQTYSGSIANGATGMNLVKTGGGIQVLSGSNTYTGTTSVSGGRLVLGSAGAFGNTSKVIVTGGSGAIGATIGSLDLAGFTVASAIPLELNSGANTNDVGAFYNSNSTAVTYSGPVELKANAMIGTGNIELTGGFTGGGFNLNKNGTLTLAITNGGNTTLGELKANRGTVQLNTGTSIGVSTIEIGTGSSVAGGLTLNGGSLTSSGQARFGQGSGSASGTLSLNAGTLTVPALTKGTLTFNANFNGGTLRASGNNTSFFPSATIARVQAGGAFIDDGGFAITIGQSLVHDTNLDTPSVTPDGGLTKSGSGTLTLSGNNTYSGLTTVSAGSLVLDSTGTIAGTFGVSVASGATFTNNGSALSKAFTLGEGATLGGSAGIVATSLGVNADLANGFTSISAGSLTAGGALTFNLTNVAAGSYSIFSSSIASSFSSVSIGATALSGTGVFNGTIGDFVFTFTDADDMLSVAAIPEPSSFAAFLGFGALGLGGFRRRRRS